MDNETLMVGGYRVVREIERDGLGVVYEAEHPLTRRRVSVRSIGREVARDVSFSRRFLLEVHGYEALEHEAIPRLYELAYDDGTPYLVTELVGGRTLAEVLEGGKRLAPRNVLGLLRPIADALDYAHARSTVHRDVRSAHILLADDGRTMLTGFGMGTVAAVSTPVNAGGQRMAPDHVAPERLVGRDIDGRADVYSLAAVIFEAITGRAPFSSVSWIETLSRRLYEPPPNACDVLPDLPPAFGEVLKAAMDRDPARRPTTAGEMFEQLTAALKEASGKKGRRKASNGRSEAS